MTLEEFKATLSDNEITAIQEVATKREKFTEDDKNVLVDYIKRSSEAFGDDQIAEPIRYIVASMGGLRQEDLQYLIGEGFDAKFFFHWNRLLDIPIILERIFPNFDRITLYDFPQSMRILLIDEIGESNIRSCASDIGYYLLEHKESGDMVRDTQTLHLLLNSMEVAASAEYISEVEGNPLSIAVSVLAKGMEYAPEGVKLAIWDMVRAQGEKINIVKILRIMLNDCIIIIGKPEKTKPIIEKLHNFVGEILSEESPEHQANTKINEEIALLYGIAKLRLAQNARLRREEEEAKRFFVAALNYLMPRLEKAEATTVTNQQIKLYWICLNVCHEMAQPKAISLIFERIIKIEKAKLLDEKLPDEERRQIAEDIISQHVDVSKIYHSMPEQLKEQFTDYTLPTVELLKKYLYDKEIDNNKEQGDIDNVKLFSYFQAFGEFTLKLERYEESYDALTQAQILQMRYLASLQKQDGEYRMSQEQLICRLALSATNHLIASHYRRQGKSRHDLGVILRSNMNLAEVCFKFYPRDHKVIHFTINAALELGDYQHQSRGLLSECGTYEKVLRVLLIAINNMKLDQQLATDVAIISTKCGQIQADKSIRRYKNAISNLEVAHHLWKALGDNTNNQTYKDNATHVQQLLQQLKGNK